MKKFYFYGILSIFILLSACKKKVPAAPTPQSPEVPVVQKKIPEPLKPIVLVYPAMGKSQVVKLKAGETINYLAQQYYGDRNYVDLILSVNQIINPRKLRVGTEIILPSFQEVFTEAGLWSKLEPELTKILQARQLYTEEEQMLRKLPRTPKTPKELSLPLTPLTEQKLKQAEIFIQEAMKGIESKKDQFQALPQRTLGLLANIQENLHRLSQGICNVDCRELDVIHQRMALMVRYLLVWAKAGFK